MVLLPFDNARSLVGPLTGGREGASPSAVDDTVSVLQYYHEFVKLCRLQYNPFFEMVVRVDDFVVRVWGCSDTDRVFFATCEPSNGKGQVSFNPVRTVFADNGKTFVQYYSENAFVDAIHTTIQLAFVS